jgi:D-3-phosphoglycerate dehydrogenase / 2-oxoglutarate reductase
VARVLVTEEIADSGLQELREAGHDVDIRLGLSPSELIEAVAGAHALIIRSATKVDGPTLEAAKDLIVVGRAGIGLDNVDVAKATELGVMVVNAPVSNILSAAEQTMALLLAQARNIPQAHTALKAGKWERSKWEGVELHGKTLGVVGLGKIGALVAQRASAFGMHLIAFDPFITEERARHMGVELVDLDTLLAQSDFITIHLPKTKETTNLLDAAALAKTKPGVRIINVARGGIVNEADLADAIRNGHVQGAALDVFEKEPTTESPLFELPSVVVVPHLGASTFEAQDKAGITIAEQVQLALAGDFVPYAVNVAAGEVSNAVRPFMGLAEVLGRFIGGLLDGKPADLEVNYLGELAGSGTKILTLCALKGLLTATGHEGVSFVNAPQLAEDHNLTFSEISTVESPEYLNQISVRSGEHAV